MMELSVNANTTGKKYVPLWKKLITAGRAAEGLRESWRKQLRTVQNEIGFEYIRFHGILHDDMMIYSEDEDGKPIYNWHYFDSLMDFLLEVKLRPILELSFMPSALASGNATIFWWKGNITPPKDYKKWQALLKEIVCHCINRYGMSEILKWYFEVWNEPDLPYFWSSTSEEYFKLYEYSVLAIKSVDKRLRVGGPATSSDKEHGNADFLESFIDYCSRKNLPVDFISTHPYPNSFPLDVGGNSVMTYGDENCTVSDLQLIKESVMRSPFKDSEIHLTEWNSSTSQRDLLHDTSFMAPFIIQNNLRCIGLADSLGFWTFTDIFEENVIGHSIFHGGFGLINIQGLKKPAYYGYWFLSRLGSEMLASGDNYFAAKKDDRLQILMWNYCHYKDHFASGDRKELSEYDRYSVFKDKDVHMKINIEGLDGSYKEILYTFGRENGSVFDEWLKNGAVSCPTSEEIDILAGKARPTASIHLYNDVKTLEQELILKPHDVMLIELQRVI